MLCGKSFLEEAGLRCHFEKLGAPIPSIKCILKDGHTDVGSGLGKGLGTQAYASALFEAIEHYAWFRDSPSIMTLPEPIDFDGRDKGLSGCSPDLELICGREEVHFSRVAMKPVGHSGQSINYPFFLTHPFWHATHASEKESIGRFALRRYSTNSGTASGVSAADALLHGLLEAVERDAIGIELLRVVVSKSPAPARRVLAENIFRGFAETVCEVERDGIEFLASWDFTAKDICVPVALVGVIDKQDGRVSFGTGASLLAEYAFERALLEAVQTVHALRTLPDRKPYRTIDSSAPAFIRCALDRGHFQFSGGVEYVTPECFLEPSVVTELSPQAQLEAIASRLTSLAMPVYRRTLLSGTVSVEQVVVPRLERFHVVTSGVPVAPSARGRSMMLG